MKKFLLLTVLLLTGLTEAAIPKHGSNSLGVVISQENPFTYRAGSVITVFDVEEGKGYVIRIQPYKTYLSFFEDILVCGEHIDAGGQISDAIDMFDQKQNPLMLVYRIRASRTVEGVGCHELVGVNEIKVKKDDKWK
jgi:hypothetical protein